MQPDIIVIDDPADARIAAYRNVRERDLATGPGTFIAEGKVVLDVLFSAGRFEAESVLLLDRRLEGMMPVLAKAPAGLPVHVASQAVLDEIAGFHLHRGILACVRRRPAGSAADLVSTLPADALVVGLVGISNHDNVGSIFRNAAAFGADAVLLDETSCDPLYRKAIRVSVGAALKVPFAIGGTASAMMQALAGAGFETLALSPGGERPIDRVTRSPRTALFLGTEGEGLPAALMQAMRTVKIGMAPGFDSLNVAAASAIALHRLAGL